MGFRNLRLEGETLDDSDMAVLAEELKVNTTVTDLSLGGFKQTMISDAGAEAVAEALKVNSTVTWLYLSNNHIGAAGAQAIAEALKVNTAVTQLWLSKSQIGNAGAQAIGEALKVNATVTEIFLYDNRIGLTGTEALAEALKVNTSVTKLSLLCDQIGDAGCRALAEALKVNSTLTGLWLSGNKIGGAGATALEAALKVNSAVTVLDLSRNPIGEATVQAIDKALQANAELTSTHFTPLAADALLALIASNFRGIRGVPREKLIGASIARAITLLHTSRPEPPSLSLDLAKQISITFPDHPALPALDRVVIGLLSRPGQAGDAWRQERLLIAERRRQLEEDGFEQDAKRRKLENDTARLKEGWARLKHERHGLEHERHELEQERAELAALRRRLAEWECPVCLEVTSEKVSMDACGHTFCEDCAEGASARGRCHTCNEDYDGHRRVFF